MARDARRRVGALPRLPARPRRGSARRQDVRPVTLPVDVSTEIEIGRPRGEVAAFAADPANATRWYANIEGAEWTSEAKLEPGATVEFVARFLGRRLAYTYEVVEAAPGERLVMRTAEGPFPMETTYVWRDAGDGRTRMTLRNRGEPSGFGRLAAALIAAAVRRANRADLRRLKAVLERNGDRAAAGRQG